MLSTSKYQFSFALLLLICSYGLYASFNRGNANAWYYKAEFSLNEWSDNNAITSKLDYDDTLTAISNAYQADQSHPHYNHIYGRILHWGVLNDYEPKERIEEVKAWYLKAAELRTRWPDPWVDLAKLNNQLEGYNQETRYYIEQAIKTGPYVDYVNVGILQVLLLNWTTLTGSERALLFERFAIATKQPILKDVLFFAKEIGREKILCIQLNFNPAYQSIKNSSVYRKYCK